MKYTIILLAALSSVASATTVVFAGPPSSNVAFFDNTGTIVGPEFNAVVEAGLASTTFISLVGVNGSTTGTIANANIPVLDGRWNGQTSNNSAEANQFNNQSIAVLITLSETDFAVATTSATFLPNGSGVNDTTTVNIDTITGFVAELSAAGTSFDAESGVFTIGTSVIPEPSVTLLGGLALFGGLLRRRK